MSRAEQIRQRLAVMYPVSLAVLDESHHHAGHAGAGTESHFRLEIVTDAFAGKSTVARHRMIYSALGDLMHNGIHALTIQARTPQEL